MLISAVCALAAPMLARADVLLGERAIVNGARLLAVRQLQVPASVAFASAHLTPQTCVDLGADFGAMLYGSRAGVWRSAEHPLYGLTTADAWFCIEHAAADVGLRAVRRDRWDPRLSLGEAAVAGRELRRAATNRLVWRPALALNLSLPSQELVSWLLVPRHLLDRSA